MQKILANLLFLTCVIAAAGYFALFRSPIGFHLLARQLKAAGLETDEISGKIASELRIPRARIGNPNGVFCELEDVTLRYSGLWDVFAKDELDISELSVSAARIRIPATGAMALFSLPPLSYYRVAYGLKVARIGKLSVAGVGISLPWNGPPLRIDQLTLTDVLSERDTLSFSVLKVKGGVLDLEYNGSTIQGTVHTALLPQLRAPIAFAGKVSRVPGTGWLEISALENRIVLKTNPDGSAALDFNVLDLAELVTDPPPVRGIRISLVLDNLSRPDPTGLRVFPGEFTIGTSRFVIAADTLVHESSVRRDVYVEGVRELAGMQVRLRIGLDPKKTGYFGLRVLSSTLIPDRELLSGVLYDRNFSKLSEVEKTQVNRSLGDFVFQ